MKKPTTDTPPKSSNDSILEGIKIGEKDIKEGKVYTHAQAKEKLKKWLKPCGVGHCCPTYGHNKQLIKKFKGIP